MHIEFDWIQLTNEIPVEREAVEAHKIGRELNEDDFKRMARLRSNLDNDSAILQTQRTPEERALHVKKLREMAEAELRHQFGPLVADVEEQREIIRDLPAAEKPKAQRELQKLLKQLDVAREVVAKQLRSKA